LARKASEELSGKQQAIAAAVALLEAKRQEDAQKIQALSKTVAEKRDDAVSARKTSGIETIWREDEEYYQGIDDLNRGSAQLHKSMSPDGGLIQTTNSDEDEGCTAFFNITRQFVDSASARMGDILLPANEWNFKIKPTPIAGMDVIEGSDQQVVDPATGQPVLKDGQAYTLGQYASEEQRDAEAKVEKAENHIHDDLTECQFKAQYRKVIESSARIGTGILRGPYPVKRTVKVVIDGKVQKHTKISPASRFVSPWNCYPAPDCGDSIHNGSYFIEKDELTIRQLRDLKDVPGYISEQIDKVLEEGPEKNGYTGDNQKPKGNERFTVWYFFGDIKTDELEACGCRFRTDYPESEDDAALPERPGDVSPVVVTMVNETVIKAHLDPNGGVFPYDYLAWQTVADTPHGVGVSRQMRTAQDMVNAGGRTLMENAGLSGKPIIVIGDGVEPADDSGDYTLRGGMIFRLAADSEIKKTSDAVSSITIPSMQVELMEIIKLGYKIAEDSTGVTFLLQGQQGSAPDTVGGMELLNRNAFALLRRVARLADENVTEPHIRRYYNWILLHGDDDEKGDLMIDAVGSSALVEREIKIMEMTQMLTMSLNPAFGWSPAKVAAETLRARRLDPSKFEMDEDEKAKLGQQAPAPAVQAAQIRAESAEKIAEGKFNHDQQMEVARLDMQEHAIQSDTDRDTLHVQAVNQRNQYEHDARMEEMRLRERLAMMEYANRHQITLDQVKGDLAGTAMKLKTQIQLAGKDGKGPQVATPLVEPAGRAPNGEAFQK